MRPVGPLAHAGTFTDGVTPRGITTVANPGNAGANAEFVSPLRLISRPNQEGIDGTSARTVFTRSRSKDITSFSNPALICMIARALREPDGIAKQAP